MLTKKFAKKYFSVFNLEKLPDDPIFGIMSQFNKDTNPNKISLTAGTYKTDENKPFILNCVRKAQELIVEKKMDHEYLGIEGLKSFVDNSLKVAYTDTNKKLQEGAIAGIQTISGTGALYVGFKFLADYYKKAQQFYIQIQHGLIILK